MTKEELEANLSKSMPDSPNLAKALAKYVTASRELAEVDSLLGTLNSLIVDTNTIEMDLANKNEALKKAEEAASSSQKSCTDPIGFMKDGARYDFIVDDGSFDSTSDFLGADNQWASMEQLDSDGDKVIDAKELKDAGIKMVKTVNGKQQVVDVADEFGEDFKVDLTSYSQGGSFDGIDTAKDSDGDGTVDQQLLGTYTIKIGNENIKGYNTLDDTDYLAQEYSLTASGEFLGEGGAISSDSDIPNSAEELRPQIDSTGFSEELKAHSNFFSEYTEISKELNKELEQGLGSFGLTQATLDSIRKLAESEAKNDADEFMEEATKEAEEEQKADDAKRKEELEAKRKKREEEKAAKEAAAAGNGGAAGGAGGAGGADGAGGGGGGDTTEKSETERINDLLAEKGVTVEHDDGKSGHVNYIYTWTDDEGTEHSTNSLENALNS